MHRRQDGELPVARAGLRHQEHRARRAHFLGRQDRLEPPDGQRLSIRRRLDGALGDPDAIGTATMPPGNLTLGTAQLSLFWFTQPIAAFNPVNFNWDRDVSLVVRSSPAVNDD